MKRVVIMGAGFAGLWAALGAARARRDLGAAARGIRIDVVAPTSQLCLKPRLYERDAPVFEADIAPLLAAVDVGFLPGTVEAIDAPGRAAAVRMAEGAVRHEAYDSLVVAIGSRTIAPPVAWRPCLHVLDSAAEARALRHHVTALPMRPPTAARFAAVVIGAGFTGLEIATELAGWLRDLAVAASDTWRVTLLDRAVVAGAALGDGPRGAIEAALAQTGVDFRPSTTVRAIQRGEACDVLMDLQGGGRLTAATVVWAVGLRAQPLTGVLGAVDAEGRLTVNATLQVAGHTAIFAAGDAACAGAAPGHATLMSCQHAMPTGRVAGHNAVRALAGVELLTYSQPMYVTCLDLGAAGAMLAHGWSRTVMWTGADAKAVKRMINGQLILPPPAHNPDLALRLADPTPLPAVTADALAIRWKAMLEAAAPGGRATGP